MAKREREIDALIAEHLFGWKQVATTRGQTFPVPADYPDGPYDEDAIKYSLTPERYSTSGNGMLAVIEAMLSQQPDWGFIIQRVSHGPWYATVTIPYWPSDSPDPMPSAKSDTISMAVALAILKASGVEVPT